MGDYYERLFMSLYCRKTKLKKAFNSEPAIVSFENVKLQKSFFTTTIPP